LAVGATMGEQPTGDGVIMAASVLRGEAFAEIFDRHGPLIHRFLARRLGADAADDLLGEVFLAAFRRRASYDQGRPDALPWLYGIAANVVAQHRRLEGKRWRLLAALPPQEVEPDHATDSTERVIAEASRARLADALAALARAEREVLLLIAWEQLSYDEAAIALQIPVGTVRSRLHRARQKVRARLGDRDPRVSTDSSLEELIGNE
jgi:RNA polymerase sigma factor (sigma-70 family)